MEPLLFDFQKRTAVGQYVIERTEFRNIVHELFGVSDTRLLDRIFVMFDRDKNNRIDFDEYVKGLSVYLRGSLDERKTFAFSLYDLNNDGYISREEVAQLLQRCLHSANEDEEDEEEELLREFVSAIVQQFDADGDSRISFSDYSATVDRDPILLEAFGECFASPSKRTAYLARLNAPRAPTSTRPQTAGTLTAVPALY